MPRKKVDPNTIEDENTASENKYPGVPVAYDLALKSYEFGERRLQAVESRNEKILGFTASLNLALIAFLSSSNSKILNSRSLLSIIFILAFLSGIASLIIGLLVMLTGRVKGIDISKIYESWLHLKEEEFKTEFIIKSANDYNETFEYIEAKSRGTNLSALLFLVEILSLLAWLIIGKST